MKTSLNQVSITSSCLPSAIHEVEGVETRSLRKKLFAAFTSILNKIDGAAMEGMCGPGVYFGASVAEMISVKRTDTNG